MSEIGTVEMEQALFVEDILQARGASLQDRARSAANDRRAAREAKAREDEQDNIYAAWEFLTDTLGLEQHELPSEGDFSHTAVTGGARASIARVDGLRMRFYHKRVEIGKPASSQFQAEPIYDLELTVHVEGVSNDSWKEIKNLADLGEILS